MCSLGSLMEAIERGGVLSNTQLSVISNLSDQSKSTKWVKRGKDLYPNISYLLDRTSLKKEKMLLVIFFNGFSLEKKRFTYV